MSLPDLIRKVNEFKRRRTSAADAAKILLTLTFCFSIISCEDLSQKPLHAVQLDLIVVDANITTEKMRHLVALTFPYQTQGGTGIPLSGAIVTLSWPDSSRVLTETPTGSGMYYTPVMRAVTGEPYTLEIQYQDKTYFAQDAAPPVEPLEPLQYAKSNGQYTLSLAASGSAPNFIKHDIDWSNTGQCAPGASCAGEVIYYDLKTSDINEAFQPDKEEFDFPVATTVIRKKYSVSASYKQFLRSMLSETEWHGGIFDVQPSPVGTNLSAGAIGFFAVSTVVSDTTVIVQKP